MQTFGLRMGHSVARLVLLEVIGTLNTLRVMWKLSGQTHVEAVRLAESPVMGKFITRYGKRAREQSTWVRDVARPYLDKTFGHVCAKCGKGDYGMHILDVDHKLTKGSRPDLKQDLDNIQYLGRIPCHQDKTDHKEML